MKQLTSSLRSMVLPLAALLFILSAYSSMPGGEGFEVYQNNKLVLQQFGSDMKNINRLQLNAANAKDQITIKYYHCGRPGKDRHLIIRTKDKKEWKNWQFADITSKDPGMSFRVADLSLPGKVSTLDVYYRSSEIPAGRLIVSLVVNG